MKAYPLKDLYQEMAFVAYYFHWPWAEVMQLPHRERRHWCEEISTINRELNGDRKNVFDV